MGHNMILSPGYGVLGGAASGLGNVTDDFNAALSEANQKWVDYESKIRAGIDAEIKPVSSAIEAGMTILENLDFSSQDAFINSVAGLVRLAGPVGGWAGEALEWINDFAKWITAAAPAFAIQLQDHNYAYLDWWLGTQVLGIVGADRKKTLMLLHADGWMPVYCIGGEFGYNSGAVVGDWGSDAVTPEVDVERFSLIAGPRSTPTALQGRANIADIASSDWPTSPEGRISILKARGLAQTLAPDGYRRVVVQTGEPGVHYAWVGQSLAFFHNIKYDLNPGYGEYPIWLRGFIVNITALPNDIVVPLMNWIYLTIQASQTVGGLTSEMATKIRKAAFGPNGEAFQKWNLTWILYNELHRNPVAIAAMCEVSERFKRMVTIAPPGKTKMETTDEGWSTGEKALAIGGGTLAVVIITKLLRIW